MTLSVAVLAGMLTVLGGVLIAAWWAEVLGTASTQASTSLWKRTVDNVRKVDRRTWGLAGVSIVAGVTVTVWTGWPLALAVVPLGVFGLPRLLSSPKHSEIELLQALDRWVRGMTATMATGKSITDAVRLSARQAPPLLVAPLQMLVRRLDDRWTPHQALARFADELDSPDADAVIASLILAVQRGGAGAIRTLSALADTIQERLKALREIEAERSKPRIVVRQVTIITLIVLGATILFGRGFFAPYSTPLGQGILAVLLTAYVISLWALRRMTLPRRRERILKAAA